METTFEITHDREFLKHFLTRWRTLSISPEMVERLKNSDDYYACYGYGRWLYFANPDGQSIKEAQEKLTLAANYGYVSDALAALAEMHYIGVVAEDRTDYQQSAFLMYKAAQEKSELFQFQELYGIIYGELGFKEDPELAADILKKHLEKHPDSDPIYWDLLGLAVAQTDNDEAIKYYMKSVEMGNPESCYSLAKYYYDKGDKSLSRQFAEEGMAMGAVNCHRAMAAFMTQDEFLALPEDEQKELHAEMDRGLRYAVEHYDRYACYVMAIIKYNGELGFEADTAEAIRLARLGCELGDSQCFELLAQLQEIAEDIPTELRIGQKETAKLYLQALRRGSSSDMALESVASAYTANLLPRLDKEMESLWLPKYYEQGTANDEFPNSLGVLKIYPQGYFYAAEVEQDKFDSLADLAQLIDADGVDIVHYSEALNRMSKVLCRGEHKGYHIAMVVDRDGYAKDLSDNMVGTILYGHGWEMRGTVMLVLEDEKYNIFPIKGVAFFSMCVKMLNAATDGLTRYPTEDELSVLEPPIDDAFEEYDDPSFLDDEEEEEFLEEEEEVVASEEDEDAEPKNITVKMADINEALAQCNLCRDTITALLPNEPNYWFRSTDELMYPIKDAVEKNIKRHGGYMIDEWQYVYGEQAPRDIRNLVRFSMESKNND
ncbi:MAG: sel1 repeat family protein [Bacteroidales bacterium]|nr:sel1 repeat family protein [Bacteroidales bacterium]